MQGVTAPWVRPESEAHVRGFQRKALWALTVTRVRAPAQPAPRVLRPTRAGSAWAWAAGRWGGGREHSGLALGSHRARRALADAKSPTGPSPRRRGLRTPLNEDLYRERGGPFSVRSTKNSRKRTVKGCFPGSRSRPPSLNTWSRLQFLDVPSASPFRAARGGGGGGRPGPPALRERPAGQGGEGDGLDPQAHPAPSRLPRPPPSRRAVIRWVAVATTGQLEALLVIGGLANDRVQTICLLGEGTPRAAFQGSGCNRNVRQQDTSLGKKRDLARTNYR